MLKKITRLNLLPFKMAFTVIELLSVMAVIALLIGLLFPVANNIISKGNKTVAASNLRQIALTYSTYVSGCEDSVYHFKTANKLSEWIAVLAKKGHLNDPELFIVKNDPLVQNHTGDIPSKILKFDGQNSWSLDVDFASSPLSIVVIKNLSPSLSAQSTPIAYTRGLNPETGMWDLEDAVYGNEGGFVAFMDGHVKFYEKIKVKNYRTKEVTHKIKESVPSSAVALDYDGVAWSNN